MVTETVITSDAKEVRIGDGYPSVLIGERINPSGRKKMAEALRAGDLEFIHKEALDQVKAGADVIDVNVSVFGGDEVSLLVKAVQAAMESTSVPLCIDSANPDALEAALKIYKGKPLVNSVTGEEKSLASVLPLAREHGAAVIGLTQDDEGIPRNTERRISIAHKIVERAEKEGISREDIIIDCLALAAGADTGSSPILLESVKRIKDELEVSVALGASNFSFGLPDRAVLNGAFAVLAIGAGANCLIADAAKIRPTVLAADLVLGRDKNARRYIEAYRERHRQYRAG